MRKDGKVFKISVKTLQYKTTHWLLQEKYEHITDPSLFYFFVYFTKDGEWDYWVVPSGRVAYYTHESHQSWENRLGEHGQPHKKGEKARGFDTKQIIDSPKEWEEEVKTYHKNISLLQD